MNRSSVESAELRDTGVADGGNEAAAHASGAPSAADRWLVGKLAEKLGDAPLRVVLWDETLESARGNKEVGVRIADRGALWQLVTNPPLQFGDLYSEGRIQVNGDLLTLLRAACRYPEPNSAMAKWLARGARIAPDMSDSKRNIHHHYDIGNDFYGLWLDREARQYTCAYFADASMTIEQAQQAKMHHVCKKLQLKPGETVIEAGGGWGGFALFMAKNYGVHVRSYNISKEQVAHARNWADRDGLGDLVEFVQDDYRNANQSGGVDVFVSVGMLEHVGAGNYKGLGAVVDRVLKPEGRGLIHSIGRDRPQRLNPWINKRIFPGAYPPTIREMMDIFEPNGLSVLDIENLRLHYAQTLTAWLERFDENEDTVRAMYGQNFVRAWRLYLAGSIASFQEGKLQLFQAVFARTGSKSVPRTRAHIYE